MLILLQVRKYLIPDSNDEIRQEQMREMELLNSSISSTKTVSNGDQDCHEVAGSDVELGDSNSPPSVSLQTSSPSPPSSTVIAMRGMVNGQTQQQPQSSRITNGGSGGRRMHLASATSQNQGMNGLELTGRDETVTELSHLSWLHF